LDDVGDFVLEQDGTLERQVAIKMYAIILRQSLRANKAQRDEMTKKRMEIFKEQNKQKYSAEAEALDALYIKDFEEMSKKATFYLEWDMS
jgi:hypothetical protein